MKRLSILIILATLFPCALMAAGSAMTMTLSNVGGSHTGMSTLTIAWTSDDATGAVSGTTSDAITAALQGRWLSVAKIKTGTGDETPTTLYDIDITDANGTNIYDTKLNDLSTTGGEKILPYFPLNSASGPYPIDSALTISITHAGNSKTGIITLTISR